MPGLRERLQSEQQCYQNEVSEVKAQVGKLAAGIGADWKNPILRLGNLHEKNFVELVFTICNCVREAKSIVYESLVKVVEICTINPQSHLNQINKEVAATISFFFYAFHAFF